MAAMLSGIPVPAEITHKIAKTCYTIVSDNDAILVGQAMIALSDNPENSRRFSETMWTRLIVVASEKSWLSDMALQTVITSTQASPDMWPHLLDIAKRSETRSNTDVFKHTYTQIMATFSPETATANFRKLFQQTHASRKALTPELAIESPKPLRYLRLALATYDHPEELLTIVVEKAPKQIKEKIIQDYCQHWTNKQTAQANSYVLFKLVPKLIANPDYFNFQTENPNADLIPFEVWRLLDRVLENTSHPLFAKACTLACLRPEKISSKIHKALPWLNPV